MAVSESSVCFPDFQYWHNIYLQSHRLLLSHALEVLLSERSYTIKIYHIDNVASLTYHLCYLLHFLNPVSNSHICPLTLMKVKNSSMVHAERVCRHQNKCGWKIEISFEKGDRNGYQHFLLFLRHFQKTSFSRSGLFGKELTLTKKQNFRIVNAERFCRQQINVLWIMIRYLSV